MLNVCALTRKLCGGHCTFKVLSKPLQVNIVLQQTQTLKFTNYGVYTAEVADHDGCNDYIKLYIFIISYHIISYHIISYHIISYHTYHYLSAPCAKAH